MKDFESFYNLNLFNYTIVYVTYYSSGINCILYLLVKQISCTRNKLSVFFFHVYCNKMCTYFDKIFKKKKKKKGSKNPYKMYIKCQFLVYKIENINPCFYRSEYFDQSYTRNCVKQVQSLTFPFTAKIYSGIVVERYSIFLRCILTPEQHSSQIHRIACCSFIFKYNVDGLNH